ncbi:hypothetical protein VE00_06024 [Pseudogymnoascus sp. WSF 3629]|nr:hypothetical protein VE00_06024 [Pseudogymnoascus sp. WSF 3629]
MTTPLHPHAVWNPAFRPNTNTTSSLPPLLPLAIATTTTTPTSPSHPSNTHLHNVTPFAAAAAAASKLDADADLKSVPLGDSRDLESGVVMKQRGVRARVEGWWAWFACLLLMGFTTVGLGTCFAFGG